MSPKIQHTAELKDEVQFYLTLIPAQSNEAKMNFYRSINDWRIGGDRRANRSASKAMSLLIMVLAGSVAATSGGCQKKEINDLAVVAPPEPTKETLDADAPIEPPGTIEMPAEAKLENHSASVASPGTEESSTARRGLEMPSDADPQKIPNEGDDARESSASKIQYATWTQIEQKATTSGKVTVVDLWSLVCEPCLKEFPGLVRLHEEHGKNVLCIAVDVDFDGRKTRPPETYEERVAAFIDSVGATFPTYISSTPSDDVYAANRLASIPAVLVYDADGNLVKVFEDAGQTAGFTYEKDVIPLVEKLAG